MEFLEFTLKITPWNTKNNQINAPNRHHVLTKPKKFGFCKKVLTRKKPQLVVVFLFLKLSSPSKTLKNLRIL